MLDTQSLLFLILNRIYGRQYTSFSAQEKARHLKEKRNSHKSKVLWFTGLSGSGKSTIANATEAVLHQEACKHIF